MASSTDYSNQNCVQNQMSQSQATNISNGNGIQNEFAEYIDDINMFMKKYNDYFAQTLKEDQKRLDEINHFHNLIREFVNFLNQKLKAQKERIAKFYTKFDEEKK